MCYKMISDGTQLLQREKLIDSVMKLKLNSNRFLNLFLAWPVLSLTGVPRQQEGNESRVITLKAVCDLSQTELPFYVTSTKKDYKTTHRDAILQDQTVISKSRRDASTQNLQDVFCIDLSPSYRTSQIYKGTAKYCTGPSSETLEEMRKLWCGWWHREGNVSTIHNESIEQVRFCSVCDKNMLIFFSICQLLPEANIIHKGQVLSLSQSTGC
jgi:hypothetical protein